MTKKKKNLYTPPLMASMELRCRCPHALTGSLNAYNESINDIDNDYEWN